MKMLIPPCASIVGSDWFGSPWLRMQFAHSTSDWAASPFETVLEVLPLLTATVVVETLATEGEPDPVAPHAASPTAAAATAASVLSRRERDFVSLRVA
jgi:hypothetical protein